MPEPQDLTNGVQDLDFDPEALRAKYRAERERRIRPDGSAQYRHLTGESGVADQDPYAEAGFTREPLHDRVEGLVVGGGFGGPYGVTIDLGGRVYAADHYRLARPEPSAEGGVTTHCLLHFSHGIVSDGELLHLTSQFGQIQTYDPEVGTTRERAGGLRRPLGITVAPDGSLVVAESDAGRVVAVDEADALTVLADGLDRPVDVAFDAEGLCYVSDERLGAVLRLETDGPPTVVVDGLDAPQGLAVLGDEVFTVETGRRRLRAVSLVTGESRTDAEDLPVGPPPGVVPCTEPALFANGMPGMARRFAGLAAGPDGSLLLSANGEGTVLRLEPVRTPDPASAPSPGPDAG